MKIRDLVYDVLTEEVKNKRQFSFLLKKWYGDNPTPEQIKEAEDNLALFFDKKDGLTIKNPGVFSFLLRWNGKHGKGVVVHKLDDQGNPMFDANRNVITTLAPFKIEDIKDPGRFTIEQFKDFIDEFKETDLATEDDDFADKNLRATSKKIQASKKLWMSSIDTEVDQEGFKVKFIPNAAVAVKYGFYQQALIQKLLGGDSGYYKQWCVTGRNTGGNDSRTNLWETYRSPREGNSRIPKRTFWFVYDESKNPEVENDPNIHKFHLCALQYCVNDDYDRYTGFKMTSLFNDGDTRYTWNQIVAIYPQLAEFQEQFSRYVEFDEGEILNRAGDLRINETEGSQYDFAAQPRSIKKSYISGNGTLKTERSWRSMDVKLRNLYILSTEAGNAVDKFQSEELIKAIKKVPNELNLLDTHLMSVGNRINENTQKITDQNLADLGVGVIYQAIARDKYRVAKTSIDNKKIQLLESKEKKYDGEGLCGLFHFGYNDWMIVDGIKYSAEYYSDDQNVYSDDEGQTYLVTTYIHVESKQEDDKSLYAIIKTTAKDVEDAEDLAETEDQVLCHFITAKQFNVLKQRIHEKADDDDEDFIKISNINPETDVDIKEMY